VRIKDHKAVRYVVCHSPVTSPFLGPKTLLSTLLSNTVNLRSSIIVSDKT